MNMTWATERLPLVLVERTSLALDDAAKKESMRGILV